MYGVDIRLAELIVGMSPDKAKSLTEVPGASWQTSTQRRGWFTQQGRQLLTQTGESLVALGEWLKGYGVPQPSC
jgi:hypothetical protein